MSDYGRGLEAAWKAIGSLIVLGELPEPQHERRNGLVLAANAVAALMGPIQSDEGRV